MAEPTEEPRVHVTYDGSAAHASVTVDGKTLPICRAEIILAAGDRARLVLTIDDFTTSDITSDLAAARRIREKENG